MQNQRTQPGRCRRVPLGALADRIDFLAAVDPTGHTKEDELKLVHGARIRFRPLSTHELRLPPTINRRIERPDSCQFPARAQIFGQSGLLVVITSVWTRKAFCASGKMKWTATVLSCWSLIASVTINRRTSIPPASPISFAAKVKWTCALPFASSAKVFVCSN
jgi:hypothetical protein